MIYQIKIRLPKPIVDELNLHEGELETCRFSIVEDSAAIDLLSVNEFFFGLRPFLSEFYLKFLKREILKGLNLKIQRAKKPFSIRVYKDALDLIEKETYWLDEARNLMAVAPDYRLEPVPTKPDLRLV